MPPRSVSPPASPPSAPSRPSDGRPELGALRAVAHPLRLRLLSLLTGRALSASEAARELGESQANVSYHLRRLHAAGLLEPAEEVAVRGGRARRYRHDPGSGPARLGAPDTGTGAPSATGPGDGGAEYAAVAAALAEELLRRSRRRLPGTPGAVTDAELWVPAATYRRALALAAELGEVLHADAQEPGTPGTVRASASLMLFAMADEEVRDGHARRDR